MTVHFLRLGLYASIALLTASAAAATPTYNGLYVFGDSYSDVGNDFVATDSTVPAPPYYNGRFSNGPVWVDHVAGFLHVPLTPSLTGGTDFAFGGAWVTSARVTPSGVIPSVPQQVGLYLASVNGVADSNALYIIQGGGNDILGSPTANPETLGAHIALGIAQSVWALRKAGARHIIVPNLFDVGLLPAAAANRASASEASAAANRWLRLLLDDSATRLDIFSLINAVVADPTHFGFSNLTTPCLAGVTVCADPDHTFFWDVEHPTEFGHSFFAVTLENALTRSQEESSERK